MKVVQISNTPQVQAFIHQHAAIGLYETMGLTKIPPFGSYTEDPLSLFMEKKLPKSFKKSIKEQAIGTPED